MDNIKTKATEHGDYIYQYDEFYRLTDTNNPDGQTDETFDYDNVGNCLSAADTTGEIKTYGWKPGSTWSTDPLFMEQNGQYYWYHNDHLGTPQKLTTTSGAVVWSAKYTSFGKATVDSSSSVENPLRFPRQYFDSETGLHYNHYRYFDTLISRYLRKDPLSYEVGINYFLYVANRPVI